jgi:D-serine deaminase-like pyridoxal phosphate-dependent protein
MEEIAVAVACPIVGKYPVERRLVIHGGAVHFSKETMLLDGKVVFGQMVNGSHQGWEPSVHHQYISSISQEHGILEDCGDWMKELKLGDTLHFLPVHSCLTANLMRGYLSTEGQTITTKLKYYGY